MMHAVLSNSRHPGYGQPTVPFPIPRGAYDDTVAALASLGIGDPVGRDCRVDELNSSFLILKRLEKVAVNVDELDYLAKRLDSSDINEDVYKRQGIAQSVEQLIRNQQVACSSHVSSSIKPHQSGYFKRDA